MACLAFNALENASNAPILGHSLATAAQFAQGILSSPLPVEDIGSLHTRSEQLFQRCEGRQSEPLGKEPAGFLLTFAPLQDVGQVLRIVQESILQAQVATREAYPSASHQDFQLVAHGPGWPPQHGHQLAEGHTLSR